MDFLQRCWILQRACLHLCFVKLQYHLYRPEHAGAPAVTTASGLKKETGKKKPNRNPNKYKNRLGMRRPECSLKECGIVQCILKCG